MAPPGAKADWSGVSKIHRRRPLQRSRSVRGGASPPPVSAASTRTWVSTAGASSNSSKPRHTSATGNPPPSALPRFEERAGASGTDWGLGAVAGARALLASNEDAEGLFAEAIERLERAQHRAAPGAHPVVLRRMAAAGESPAGRPPAAQHRLRDVHPDGCAGLRRTGATGAGRDRREGAQAAGQLGR